MKVESASYQTQAGAPAALSLAESIPAQQKWVILTAIVTTLFLAALDSTIVATAQPTIIRQFQGIELISWVTAGYLLSSTAMVPILGNLSDLYGRKIVIMIAIVVFLCGSALSGAAPGMVFLIFARVLQGVGAAGISAISFAVIADLWVPAERPQIYGIITSVYGLAGVVGPFVGGWLTDHVSWRAVFYVNVPVGMIALLFVARRMPRLASGVKSAIDWLGVTLMLVTVVPFLLALTMDKKTHAWTSPLVLGLFAVAAVGLVLFLLVESRAERPLIPLHLFKNKTFTVAITSSFLFGAGFYGSLMYLIVYMVGVGGASATKAGGTLTPMMLSLVVGAIISSAIAQKTGRYKHLILLGFLIMAAAMYLMSTMTAGTSLSQVFWQMVLLGLGIGPTLPQIALAVTNAVPVGEVGVATSTRTFFQSIGQTLAVSIFGVMLAANVTTQIDTRLQPTRAGLPAAFASQFDTARLKNQVGGDGGGSGTTDIAARIRAEIAANLATTREQLTLAVEKDDPVAQKALMANPLLPDRLKQSLQPGALDAAGPAARSEALKAALSGLDQAEPSAYKQGEELAVKVTRAIKESLAGAVTPIFLAAAGILAIGFLVALLLPELPLRKGRSGV